MDVVNQPSASPFAGLVLEPARGSSIETPPPSVRPPRPPVQIIKRSVSSAAADCGRLMAAKNWSPAAGRRCRCSDVIGRQDGRAGRGGAGEGRRSGEGGGLDMPDERLFLLAIKRLRSGGFPDI